MQYYDVADEETGKNYIPEIKAGASQTVHMAWLIGEDEVDQLYLCSHTLKTGVDDIFTAHPCFAV